MKSLTELRREAIQKDMDKFRKLIEGQSKPLFLLNEEENQNG